MDQNQSHQEETHLQHADFGAQFVHQNFSIFLKMRENILAR